MRREDWAERLAQLVEARIGLAFSWGEHDCALFAADCVLAMTGIDHAQEFRGRYTSARGAMRALEGRSLDALLDARFERIAPAFMGRGDVCAVGRGTIAGNDFQLALGVCLGARVALPGESRLEFLPVSAACHAWRVD